VRWLILAGLVVGCGSAPFEIRSQHWTFRGAASVTPHKRHPRIAALPIIARLKGGNTDVILRGHMTKRQARRAIRLAKQVYRDFNRRLADSDRGEVTKRAVDLCLFRTTEGYWRTVEGIYGHRDFAEYGFYMGSDRLVLVNWAKSTNNIRHELAHPLIGDDFPNVPAWLNEGLASLYTSIAHKHGKVRFLDNYRLRRLKRAIRTRTVPSLHDLAHSTHENVHGRKQSLYYATGRYLLLYLERKGQLASFYRAMRSSDSTPDSQLELLERYVDHDKFVRWARRRHR